MLTRLPNYDKWKEDTTGYWEIDKDILCEKYNISPKIYSERTCHFIPHYINQAERNKRVGMTGKLYLGISPDNKEHTFSNIKLFSRTHNLCDTHVGRCLNGKAKTHRGWVFKTILNGTSKYEIDEDLDKMIAGHGE